MLKFSFYPLCKLMVKCVVEMFSNWQLWIKMKSMILENAFSAKYWNHQSTEVENLSIGKKYVCWKGNMLTNLYEKSFLFIWKRILWRRLFLKGCVSLLIHEWHHLQWHWYWYQPQETTNKIPPFHLLRYLLRYFESVKGQLWLKCLIA